MDEALAALKTDLATCQFLDNRLRGKSTTPRSKTRKVNAKTKEPCKVRSVGNADAESVSADIRAVNDVLGTCVKACQDSRKRDREESGQPDDTSDFALSQYTRFTDKMALEDYKHFLHYVPRLVNVVTVRLATLFPGAYYSKAHSPLLTWHATLMPVPPAVGRGHPHGGLGPLAAAQPGQHRGAVQRELLRAAALRGKLPQTHIHPFLVHRTPRLAMDTAELTNARLFNYSGEKALPIKFAAPNIWLVHSRHWYSSLRGSLFLDKIALRKITVVPSMSSRKVLVPVNLDKEDGSLICINNSNVKSHRAPFCGFEPVQLGLPCHRMAMTLGQLHAELADHSLSLVHASAFG